MEARHRPKLRLWFEKLWLIAFAALQLAWLWQSFGRWWFHHVS